MARTNAEAIPGAGSARKVLDVLFCFTASRPVWSAPELASRIDVSAATMYRYLALLRDVGVLDDDGNGSYRMSMRVQAFTAAAEAARSTMENIAMPIMNRIRDEVDETVLLARRAGTHAFSIERVESRHQVRMQFDIGQAMPLHLGSMPRVLLAAMPAAERADYLNSVFGDAPRPGELTEEALREVVANGYTQSFGEIDDGIWGVAAAISIGGATGAALGVAAPMYRLDARQRERIIAAVRDGAREISELVAFGSHVR
ncbi:IclR family transcriptional regulator [Microbacterium sp. NPDC055910]|uniref:IclR family transcriptional regulator n=1 Tax=Microbacterium sp. NPDC055910 TaxID=3345659 RepID=UPI0035E02265